MFASQLFHNVFCVSDLLNGLLQVDFADWSIDPVPYFYVVRYCIKKIALMTPETVHAIASCIRCFGCRSCRMDVFPQRRADAR